MPSAVAKIQTLMEWAPVLQLLSKLSAAKDAAQKAEVSIQILKALAVKTATPVDDAFLALLDAALRTPEGVQLFDYIFAHLASMEIDNA
jgi:hypothetical protein